MSKKARFANLSFDLSAAILLLCRPKALQESAENDPMELTRESHIHTIIPPCQYNNQYSNYNLSPTTTKAYRLSIAIIIKYRLHSRP